MGTSEHYCLRWNNHQSNLLGVFSELLRDESLVDVTLACSEGHSIRAHRVVLSACSSYFQTLFVDHPNGHPIVILKDVRFAELRTIIEFMYRGEVNVEYCQLSELLKTAESLKVKGLAEMTNISCNNISNNSSVSNSSLRADALEPPAPRLPTDNTSTTTTTMAPATHATEPISIKQEYDYDQPVDLDSSHSRLIVESAVIRHEKDDGGRYPCSEKSRGSFERIEHYRQQERILERLRHSSSPWKPDMSNERISITSEHVPPPNHQSTRHDRVSEIRVAAGLHSIPNISSIRSPGPPPPRDEPSDLSERCSSREVRGEESDQDSTSSPPPPPSPRHLSPASGLARRVIALAPPAVGSGPDDERSLSSRQSPKSPRDSSPVAPTSRESRDPREPTSMELESNNNTYSTTGATSTILSTTSGGGACSSQVCKSPKRSMDGEEPIAGPSSGLPPMQQVPLSLKKEVDWGGGASEDKSTSEGSSEFRHPYESLLLDDDALLAGNHPRIHPFNLLWGMFGTTPLDDASSHLLRLLNGRLVAGEQSFRCVICLANFPSAWLLKRHAMLQHSFPGASTVNASLLEPAGSPTDTSSGEEKPFVCDQCGQSYRYRSAYLKHREQNHRARLPADKLFTCDVCGMQFRYLKSFKKHRLNHALERLHGKPLPIEPEDDVPDDNNEVTSTIDETGLQEDELEADNKQETSTVEDVQAERSEGDDMEKSKTTTTTTTTTPKPLLEQDDTIDSISSEQQQQKSMAAGGTSLTIPLVNKPPYQLKSFELPPRDTALLNLLQTEAASVTTYDRHHPRELRRFACPFCGKCVRSKENLKLHVRKHTGERPFVCLFCGRAFGGKSDLTRHLRIHTGERPYHCESCGKCFARADYLSKHLTTHMHNPAGR